MSWNIWPLLTERNYGNELIQQVNYWIHWRWRRMLMKRDVALSLNNWYRPTDLFMTPWSAVKEGISCMPSQTSHNHYTTTHTHFFPACCCLCCSCIPSTAWWKLNTVRIQEMGHFTPDITATRSYIVHTTELRTQRNTAKKRPKKVNNYATGKTHFQFPVETNMWVEH